MSRLYDRILKYGVVPQNHYAETLWMNIGELMLHEELVVVSLDNVARYYWAETDQEEWIIARDFPNVLSPFELAFYEFRHPGWVRSAVRGDHYEQPATMGVLTQTFDFTQEWAKNYRDLFSDWSGEAPDARYMMCAALLYEPTKNEPVRGPLAEFRLPIMEGGRVATTGKPDEALFSFAPFFPLDTPKDKLEQAKKNAQTLIYPMLLGISFMHCKNVEMATNLPLKKVQAKRIKRGDEPLTKYYTLEIDPMRKVLRRHGAENRNGASRALHICRGHFATYSADKPLFGKHSGTFWKPQHIKGSKGSGKVEKDYSVDAPKGA